MISGAKRPWGGKGGKDLNRERDLREEKETQREKGP